MSGIVSVLQNALIGNQEKSILDKKDANDLFSALRADSTSLENLSSQFLQVGIEQHFNGDYKEAAKSFEAAINISPQSEYTSQTAQYLSQAYLKLDQPDKAIAAYKKIISMNPTNSDIRSQYGQLLYSEERYDEAVVQYKAAMELDPSNANNRYSYGEALLKVKNYAEAEYQFQQVKRMDPTSYAGDYGLGKTYAQSGDYDRAIRHFEAALRLNPEFHDARAEIGYAYADDGNIAKAKEVLGKLEKLDDALAKTLKEQIDQKEPPRISTALADSTFPYNLTMGLQVSAIDEYLKNEGASASVTMKFRFSKDMDIASIENRLNWTISRASSYNLAETYNYGEVIPDTEVLLSPLPDYVLYDPETRTATVGFTIRQNETEANGTIDPSHIVFSFNGTDVNGIAIDSSADQYSGFSGSF